VITCNRCGSISPASVVSCQNCGAPLSNNNEIGLSSSRSFQEQPELPAWLESLRAGERPSMPADNPSNFSTADLIEEGSLPSWMRSGRPEMNDTSLSSPHLSLRPSSAPGPNTDDSKGINAKSLIDEQSLPSWMQENKQPTGPIPGGLAASSLVQQDFMPDWMKSLQQRSPISDALPSPAQPMASPSSAFPVQPKQAPMPERTNEISPGVARGFSASDLVDKQSLPSWMTQQEGRASVPAQPAAGETLASSSLVDVDALPSWLRESNQQGQKSGGLPPVQSYPWQATQPPMQAEASQQLSFGQSMPPSMPQGSPVWQPPQVPFTPEMNTMPAQGGGMSAASFIDPNALPQWLRSGAEQSHQAGSAIPFQPPMANQRSGYNIPPRVENVRVPSRPRGEINPNEGNEAAANVFASMLGVASTSPNFPGSPPVQGYGMQGGPGVQGMPASPMQNPSPLGNMPGQGAGFNNSQGMQGPPQSYPGEFNGGRYPTGNLGQGNYPTGNSFSGGPQYQAGSSGVPSTPNGMGNLGMETDGQRASTKPAKKGWFDMIRDWFR
jgi:hypothetical protein